ncbi:MAG: DUF4058 family protein [Cyanobacteria bacterium P01_H01_bin.119]
MSSPFPGMDPYLEHPDLWPEVHSRLLVAIADSLGPKLRPKYRIAIEKRVYEDTREDLLVGRPDATVFKLRTQEQNPPVSKSAATLVAPITVELPMPEEIQERYLEVREVGTGTVVTTLELISPSNKRPGNGRRQYEDKRIKILTSSTHLVEIDLIRAFAPLPRYGLNQAYLYGILVSRASQRPQADLYAFNLRSPIPAFPLPLMPDDAEPIVDLQPILAQLYNRASYDLAIDYSQNPLLPLDEEDLAWADSLLREKGYR